MELFSVSWGQCNKALDFLCQWHIYLPFCRSSSPSQFKRSWYIFFVKPWSKIKGKKSKIQMSEMNEHICPKSIIKKTYIKIISLQKMWKLWSCPCCHRSQQSTRIKLCCKVPRTLSCRPTSAIIVLQFISGKLILMFDHV